MDIHYKNYKMVAESPGRFTLYETIQTSAKKDTDTRKEGETYEFDRAIGYSYSFETALRKIAETELYNNKSVGLIPNYITGYKSITEQLKNNLR